MLTQQFKNALILGAALVVLVGLTADQVLLTQKIAKLERQKPVIIIISPSPTPSLVVTATPSAALTKAPLQKAVLPTAHTTGGVK